MQHAKWHEQHIGKLIFLAGAILLIGGIWFVSLLSNDKQKEQSLGFTSNTSGSATGTQNANLGDPSTCLVGWWTMDGQDVTKVPTASASGTIRDRSGNGNHGTVSTSTSPIAGKMGQAYNFNGSITEPGQSYISIPGSSALEVTTAFGISMWTKWNTTSTTADRFAWRYSGNFGYRMYQGKDSTSIVCSFHPADESLPTVTSTTGLNDNKWHHTFCVYDGTQLKMWTDGVATTGDSTSTVPFYQTSAGAIGRGANEVSRPFQGGIDDVRIYNCAPPTTTVLQVYNQGLSKINESLNPVTDGLIGWWSFDGGTLDLSTTPGVSSTLRDMSAGGNNMNIATNSGAIAFTLPVFAAGKIGQAGNFAATNQWRTLRLASSSPLFPTSTNVSISAWAKFTDVSATGMIFRCSNNSGYRLRSVVTTGLVNFSFFDSAGNLLTVNSPSAMNDGRWHHYAGVYNKVDMRLYVDGVVAVGSVTSTDIVYVNNVCGIGSNPLESNFPFTGQIDDVKIYSKALSASEVANLYNNGK